MSESLVVWNHPLPGDPFLPLGPLHFTSLLSGILCLMGCPVASLPSLLLCILSLMTFTLKLRLLPEFVQPFLRFLKQPCKKYLFLRWAVSNLDRLESLCVWIFSLHGPLHYMYLETSHPTWTMSLPGLSRTPYCLEYTLVTRITHLT